MRIKYKASPDDIVAFNQFHYRHSTTVRRNSVIYGIIIPAGVFVWCCLNGLYAGSWDIPVIGGVMSGVLMLWILVGQRRRLEKIVRKMLSEGSGKSLIGEREMEITETGLISRSEYGEGKFTWDAIERIGFTPDYTFIFTSAVQGIPIAKSSVLEGDYEEFGDELRRKFEEKAGTEGIQQKRDSGKRVITDTRKIYKEDAGFGKHSGCGIASFIIAIVVGALDLLLFVLMVIVGVIVPEMAQRGSAMLCMFITVVMLGLGANIIGVMLGISSLCQKNRKKLFPILGLVFNLAAVIGFGVLIAIGKAISIS